MKCRLRQNVIAVGKFYQRDSIIDDAMLPERLRDSGHVDYDLESREGKVLILRDLSFHSVQKPGSDGIPTAYPVHVAAGELLELTRVPPDCRERLREGEDFKSAWTYEELTQLQKAQADIYAHQPETEPVFQNR